MIRSQTVDGKTTVAPEGNIGMQDAEALAQVMDESVEQGNTLQIDLTHCNALCSSAIGAMIAAHNALKTRGFRLQVSGVSEEIRRLLKLMQLDRHFDVA